MRILESRGMIAEIEAEHLCMPCGGEEGRPARYHSAARGQMVHATTHAEATALIGTRR